MILSLAERVPREAARLIARPPKGAEALEIRLDLLRSVSPARLSPPSRKGRRILRIATCRSAGAGGGFRGGERERGRILLEAAAAGFDYVDVEVGTSAARALLEAAPGRVILSHHDRRRTPSAGDLFRLYRKMAASPGVGAVKIVTTAVEPSDLVEIRKLLSRTRGRPVPLASFAMGERGLASRILALSWGSWGTYVCTRRDRRTAPGQLTLEEALSLYRIDSIDSSTRLAGIIGDPVSHSLSPLIHNAAYAALGMNWRYLPFQTRKVNGVPDLVRGLGLRGLSVTAPHKVAVVGHLKGAEPLARRLGAVNTVVSDGRRLFGFNTDVEGVARPVQERIDPSGLVALVLGAGGAGRAAGAALAALGARIVIASRRRRPGMAAARMLGGRWIPFDRASREPHAILINATSLGASGRGMPVPRRALSGRLVGDLVYRAGGTPLVRAAREKGIPAFGGEEVLLAQGASQFSLFTGREAPEAVMGGALSRAVRGRKPGYR